VDRNRSRGGLAAEARLESHDERVERDREEGRRERPYEQIAHLRQQVGDEGQSEQAQDDLDHGHAADVDRQPARRGFARWGVHGRQRGLLDEPDLNVRHSALPMTRGRREERRGGRLRPVCSRRCVITSPVVPIPAAR
jgi:hypothetical protein